VKKILKHFSILSVMLLPVLSFAEAEPKLDGYLQKLLAQGSSLLRQLLVFLISLAVVWFIWNVIKYAMSADEDGKEKARNQMVNGIIAIAVVVSVWGIVFLLQSIFGLDTNNSATPAVFLETMIPRQ
jgi:uncharacterized membrane protein